MAAYVDRRVFGQYDGEELGVDMTSWGAGGTDASPDYSVDPGYSVGDQGGGGVDWTAIGATALNAAASVINTMATQHNPSAVGIPVGATPGVPARPGSTSIAAGGSLPSSLLVVGGLGLLAVLLMKK